MYLYTHPYTQTQAYMHTHTHTHTHKMYAYDSYSKHNYFFTVLWFYHISTSTVIFLSFVVSKDDAFAHLNRPRTLAGDVSPVSMSQTHLIGDSLPVSSAMVRSNSDSSLMVDLEKTGKNDMKFNLTEVNQAIFSKHLELMHSLQRCQLKIS